mgnify:CR=1 FL=1
MDTTALAIAATTLPEVELVVLFGSAATGRQRPDSDVDVGVLLSEDNIATRESVLVTLGQAISWPLDLTVLNDAGPQLKFEIAKGKLIFERRPGVWRDMKARAMLEWWDWQGTARWMHGIYAERLRKQVGASRGS